MKKIIILLFAAMMLSSDSHSQWIAQNSGTNQNLYDIEFINDKTGWAVGDAGVVIKTTNGGTNWLNVPNPSGQYGGLLWSVCPVDSEVVYVVAGYDFIMKTVNGGNNWNILSGRPGSITAFKSVYFLNRDTGWFLGSNKVFRTYNGGNTFDSSYVPSFTNSDIYFKDIDTGILCGDGRVFKTSNGGINWNNTGISPGIFYMFRKLAVVNNKVWLAASGDAPVFYSSDFCESWNVLDTIDCYPPSVIYSIAFASDLIGWAGGTYGWLYKTTDGGNNWLREETSKDPRFWGSIYCFSDSIVWGVGGAGKIQYTTTGGQTLVGISSQSENLANDFKLFQNYPNPFNSQTKLGFEIIKKNTYKMEVFDISGKMIELIFERYFSPGNYEYLYNFTSLTSGIYFYRLSSNEVSIQKKFLLLK